MKSKTRSLRKSKINFIKKKKKKNTCRKSFSNYQVILSVYQIISFYFEYLERVKFADDGELETLLNQLEAPKKPFVLFVLNDNETTQSGGTHWSLLVFSRPEKVFFPLRFIG